MYCRTSACDQNFKLKLCTCTQSHALGTRTKFQLEILIINVISGVVYFREIILESSRNVSETTPQALRERNPPVTRRFLHKVPVTQKMSPWHDVIMKSELCKTMLNCHLTTSEMLDQTSVKIQMNLSAKFLNKISCDLSTFLVQTLWT